MRFLDVRTDYAFKKVFGSEKSKDVLLDFLNAILRFGPSGPIRDLVIVDPYQIPLLKGMKDTYVDVKAVLSDGSQVIVEMQVLTAATSSWCSSSCRSSGKTKPRSRRSRTSGCTS